MDFGIAVARQPLNLASRKAAFISGNSSAVIHQALTVCIFFFSSFFEAAEMSEQ